MRDRGGELLVESCGDVKVFGEGGVIESDELVWDLRGLLPRESSEKGPEVCGVEFV